ncbi:unnamed protein product [Phytophthora lilii]|uniref:Unnamed protein product n=1 Tax=Phytophthora lilii TaxID=2077276 RepID=A0A9W6WMJ0_9STRA|nr:unnamed protein product [Phytophthora lilii]
MIGATSHPLLLAGLTFDELTCGEDTAGHEACLRSHDASSEMPRRYTGLALEHQASDSARHPVPPTPYQAPVDCHHHGWLRSRLRQHGTLSSASSFPTPQFAAICSSSRQPRPVPMTESYYMGSSCRGSIRSCDFQSSNNSAASPVSARNALLSASSINAVVTDRELFTTATSVVPKLRAVVEHHKDSGRSSSVWQSSLSDIQHPPCWVTKKKQHGAEIREFDRAKLPSARGLGGPTWLRGSTRTTDARHSMIESRSSLYTRDAFMGEHTHSEVRARELQQWPLNDLNVTYAVSAQVTLSCRLDEAMTMLFSRDTLQFDASMGALFGPRKYKSGDLLVSREFRKNLHTVLAMEAENAQCWEDEDLNDLSQPGWIALQSVVLRSRRSLNPMTAAKHASRRQRLCFSAYSQYCPDANEAFYTMKTLPKPMHDKFTRRRDGRTSEQAIRGDLDHIAAGYHLASSYSDLSGHQTRIIMTAYVSSPAVIAANASRPRSRFWGKDHTGASARHYVSGVANVEAKYVVNLLAAATTSFEQVVRRRRLGYQPFRQVPTTRDAEQDPRCSMCLKSFGLLRPQRFCQLCAHRVCRECSRKFDIESVARRVRRNRICFACVANVDASVFQQENPLLGASFARVSSAATTGIRSSCDGRNDDDSAASTKISTAFYDILLRSNDSGSNTQPTDAEEEWMPWPKQSTYEAQMHRLDRSSSAATASASFSSTPGRQLADALFSGDPLARARALEIVRQVVRQVTSDSAPTSSCSTASSSSTVKPSIPVFHPQFPDRKMVDKYLEARLHLSSISVSGDVANRTTPRERSSSLYGSQQVMQRPRRSTNGQGFSSSTRPSMVPRPWTTTANLETELDLDDDLNSAALDSICEVAALRMRCAIAYIVALNSSHSLHPQRVVGSSGAPHPWTEEVMVCPFPLVANGKPFVIKDPTRDPRLRHLQLVRDIGVRFFAGFPIKSPDGSVVACLCTVDANAREKISMEDLRAMHALSKLASDMFEEEVNPSLSAEAKDFLTRLLDSDPSKRLTAKQALQHSWLSGVATSEEPLDSGHIQRLQSYQRLQQLRANILAVVMGVQHAKLGKTSGEKHLVSHRTSTVNMDMFRETFALFDKDESGCIDRDELRSMLLALGQQLSRFAFDENRDGFISSSELEHILHVIGNKNVSREEICKIIAAADKNEDGKIDYNEFCALMQQQAKSGHD